MGGINKFTLKTVSQLTPIKSVGLGWTPVGTPRANPWGKLDRSTFPGVLSLIAKTSQQPSNLLI